MYPTSCKRNPVYPKTRLLCGEIQRIKSPAGSLERMVNGQWSAKTM